MEITSNGFSSSQESQFVFVNLGVDTLFSIVTPSGYTYSQLSGNPMLSSISARYIPKDGQIFPQGVS